MKDTIPAYPSFYHALSRYSARSPAPIAAFDCARYKVGARLLLLKKYTPCGLLGIHVLLVTSCPTSLSLSSTCTTVPRYPHPPSPSKLAVRCKGVHGDGVNIGKVAGKRQ